jgi:HSP20 family molecular chaperone IbpA
MNQDAPNQSSKQDESKQSSTPATSNGSSNRASSNGSSASPEKLRPGPIFTPPADILEKGDTAVIYLDVPGADAGGLDVTLERRILTISARVTSPAPEGYAPAYMEFRDGVYERRFAFSDQMDGGRIDATIKDGVLRLTIPKSPDAGAKKISVKAA